MKEPAHDGERLSARDGRMNDGERETHAYDERLSALLDGRLDEREREALLADLDVPGDDYEVLAETAAILRALEEEDALLPPEPPVPVHSGTPGTESAAPEPPPPEATPLRAYVVRPRAGATRGATGMAGVPEAPDAPEAPRSGPFPARPRTGGWKRRTGAMVAVLALTLAGGLLVRGRSSATTDPVVPASALGRVDAGLPAGWTGTRPWKSVRGRDRSVDAVRAGVLFVDLAVAVRARDSAATADLARQLHTRFLRGPISASPLGTIEARAGAPGDSLRPLLAEVTAMLEPLGKHELRLGAWVEAARLAAHTRDAAFFRARRTGSPPPLAERLAREDGEIRRALNRVRSALPAGASPDWEELEGGLQALLAALTT